MVPKHCILISLVIMLTASMQSHGQSASTIAGGGVLAPAVEDAGKAILQTKMGSQMAQGFGYCPSASTYTMQVWNDLSSPVDAYLQGVVPLQGGGYASTNYAQQYGIPAYSSSTLSNFTNINICLGIVKIDIANGGSNVYMRPDSGVNVDRGAPTTSFQIEQNDSNTYLYHTFQTSETDNPNGEGEFMGPGMYGGPFITVPDFDGVFFNNSPYDAQLTFKKNGQTYSVSLESLSFSVLSSDSGVQDSIRSASEQRSFNFKVLTNVPFNIPISALGLGDLFYDTTTSTTNQIPLTYTYEIYHDTTVGLNVAIQGFNMGNHHQLGVPDISMTDTITTASLLPIRDINPVDCYVWYQTPAQYQQIQALSTSTTTTNTVQTQIPYQAANTSVWAAYKTSDWAVAQQITAGVWSTNNFQIIRPRVSDGNGCLYIFSLNTTDQTKATQFLTNVAQDPSLTTSIAPITITNPLQIPTNASLLPTTAGIITDAQSGITGALLLTDTFVPYGTGEKLPRYYQVTPSLLQADDSFASVVTSNLDSTTFNQNQQQAAVLMSADFRQNIVGWLTTFNTNVSAINPAQINLSNVSAHASDLQGLVPDLTSYVQTHGLASLFNNPTVAPASRTFSPLGLKKLYLMLFGPLSLNSPPIIQKDIQARSNVYLGLTPGQLPQNWPTS